MRTKGSVQLSDDSWVSFHFINPSVTGFLHGQKVPFRKALVGEEDEQEERWEKWDSGGGGGALQSFGRDSILRPRICPYLIHTLGPF